MSLWYSGSLFGCASLDYDDVLVQNWWWLSRHSTLRGRTTGNMMDSNDISRPQIIARVHSVADDILYGLMFLSFLVVLILTGSLLVLTAPSCLPVQCGTVPQFSFADTSIPVNTTVAYPSVINYKCYPGYGMMDRSTKI